MGLTLAIQACSDATSSAHSAQQLAESESIPAVFTERCGQCHLPPRPTAHRAKEWPSVIERMQRHIVQKGRQRLAPGEREVILDYLLNGVEGS